MSAAIPIACTLSPAAADVRLDEWSRVLRRAVVAVERPGPQRLHLAARGGSDRGRRAARPGPGGEGVLPVLRLHLRDRSGRRSAGDRGPARRGGRPGRVRRPRPGRVAHTTGGRASPSWWAGHRAAGPVGSTVEDRPALRAQQAGPAGRVPAGFIGRDRDRLAPVHGEEIDREAHRTQRADLVLDVRRDRLLHAGPSSLSMGGSPAKRNRRAPSWTRIRPHVATATRWAWRRPAGRLCSVHSGLVRTGRRPSGSSAGRTAGIRAGSRPGRPAARRRPPRSGPGTAAGAGRAGCGRRPARPPSRLRGPGGSR